MTTARSLSSPVPSSEVSRDSSRPNVGGGVVDRDQVYTWILELTNPETREHALIELRYGPFSLIPRLLIYIGMG